MQQPFGYPSATLSARLKASQTWSEEDIDYLSKLEKIVDVGAIVQTLQFRCICDCQMHEYSDVKLGFVRWFKAKVEHMTNNIYNVIEAETNVFRVNLP
ncbi:MULTISPECIES: hypothetical protein [unclassified Microcoleus]|uniref:hypothetical protein n=1 Tax=unclassified Microcoleus TaxID=2642155 RepID=UPI002FCEFA1D